MRAAISIEFVPLSDRQVHAHISTLPELVDENGELFDMGKSGRVVNGMPAPSRISIAYLRRNSLGLALVCVEPITEFPVVRVVKNPERSEMASVRWIAEVLDSSLFVEEERMREAVLAPTTEIESVAVELLSEYV